MSRLHLCRLLYKFSLMCMLTQLFICLNASLPKALIHGLHIFSVDPPIQHLPAAGVAFAAAPEYVVGRGDNPAVCSVEIRDVSSKALESV